MVDMPNVIDVTDDTFEQVVVEGSKQAPVVVDLWAAWCGPCRTLGPMLERAAERRAGAFTLAKVDVDAQGVGNALLQAVRSQSIPTVVAFRDGQPVSMFVGAIPEQEIDRFLDSILPSEAEAEAKEAVEELEAGDLDEAERGFHEVLEKEPGNRDAAVGLARILLTRGDIEEARQLLRPHVPDPEAEHVLAEIEVRDWASLSPDGPLAQARLAAARGDWTQALEGMIAALADDKDEARRALVTAFSALGDDDPLVPAYRRKLAAALY
jgi:putative thioredoxin